MANDVLQCHLDKPEKLNVGDLFFLLCDGLPEGNYQLNGQAEHQLILLSAKPTDKGMTVTSYKVGQHHAENLKLVRDDGAAFRVSPLQFEVQSVLAPNQPAEPFPAFGATFKTIPVSLVLTVAILLALLVGVITVLALSRKKRARFLRDLRSSEGFDNPLNQLHKTLRGLRRSTLEKEDLQTFALMLPKALQLYFEQMTARSITWNHLKWLDKIVPKKNQSLYTYCLRRLRELQRFSHRKDMSRVDCEQVEREILEMVERIHPHLSEQRRVK